MVYVKNHCTKLVFFLFCLSLQVQGESDMVSKESDNPYNELLKEIRKSTRRISGLVKNRLIESGVPIDKLEKIYQEYTNERITSNKIKELEMEIFLLFNSNFFFGLVEDLEFEDPKINKKIKELNAELKELSEGTINSLSERFYEVKEHVVNRTKPIANRLIPIVKDVEELIFHIIPEKNKEIKKN